MAYSLKLAERIKLGFGDVPFVEKKMFGGVGYLIHGNMACGIYKDNLIIRVSVDKFDSLIKKPNTKLFDITGKPMKGWLMVTEDGYKTSKQLYTWIKEGIEFALTLPSK